MKRLINGFHLDSENDWVAELDCGHRASRMGQPLNCVRCDELAFEILDKALPEIRQILSNEYESAGISGLCDEGRLEAAAGALTAKEILARVKAND